MELVYLYIGDDGRNIKNCEFNFSPKYRFHFDKNRKKLSLKIGEQLTLGWFGNNIDNVTAIIGKNGTGKSNLIDCVINALCGQGGGVVVWSYRGELYRNKCSFEIESDFQIKELDFWGSPFNIDIEQEERITDTAIIYFSPNIDRKIQRKFPFHGCIDVSTANLLRIKNNYTKKNYNSYYFSDIDYMQITDTFKQILFFIYYQNEFLLEDIRVPEYLDITLRSYDIKNEKHPTCVQLMKGVDNSFSGQLRSILIKQFFSNDEIPKSWNTKTTFEEVLKHFLLNTNERPNIYNELIDLYSKKNIRCKLSEQKASSKWDYFTFSIKRTALNIRLMTALFSYYFTEEPCYASFSTLRENVSNNNISIRWDGLSSGEQAFYNFLARINSELTVCEGEIHIQAKDEVKVWYNNDYKHFIIVLDEPELSFHPEWQQKFLNLFLNSLEELYPNFRFQVIIASHSPILVSDIPKSNIIFLDKDENGNCKTIDSITRENTFGANIHTLYKNSFFMDGLPIGEFAKRKIDRLFKELQTGNISEEIHKEILLIGEPLFKNQLIKMYNDNLPNGVNKRVTELEKEVEELKRQLNDKN